MFRDAWLGWEELYIWQYLSPPQQAIALKFWEWWSIVQITEGGFWENLGESDYNQIEC